MLKLKPLEPVSNWVRDYHEMVYVSCPPYYTTSTHVNVYQSIDTITYS